MILTKENKKLTPFLFPEPRKRVIVETDLMLEIEGRIMAIHELCGLVICYGWAGVGKTTTAEWMVERCNNAFAPHILHAFKAVIYEVAKVRAGWGNEAKRALRSLYVAVSNMPIDEGLYGRLTAEELADLVLTFMKRNRIQLVFVDEAGLLSIEAINGLVLLSDKARQQRFNITIGLIGMDDLPQKLDVNRRPQINRRIHEWCYFDHYDFEQTEALLKAIHPYFAKLDSGNVNDCEEIKYIHEISNGLPGYITQFVSRFDAQYQLTSPSMVNLLFLKAVHMRNVQAKLTILKQAKNKGNTTPKTKQKKKK